MARESIHNQEIADGNPADAKLGKSLGYFSIGLGVAELLAPRTLARLIGVERDGLVPTTLRAFGAREIATGVGLLAKPTSTIGPWTRVAGDVLDLAMLSLALGRKSYARERTIGAMAAVAGVAALDVYAGVRRARRQLGEPVKRSITIARPPHEVYAIWRNFERLPEFMTWVESVRDLGANKSHWKVKTPAGVSIEYDAEITEDVPNRRIAWRSLPGATVPNCGTVTFLDAPGNRGTEILVELQVAAPLGKTIAGSEALGDLRRLKQILETGEIVKSDASIHKGPHPAQPAGINDDDIGGMR
jgi:uncharacterized membrane protein